MAGNFFIYNSDDKLELNGVIYNFKRVKMYERTIKLSNYYKK